jgi:hydroxymethylglutaryl-CoA lyase
MSSLPAAIRVVEVGPRDGLQGEAAVVPAGAKIQLVRMLAAGGCREIEVTSFVRADRVPQMADAAEVLAGLRDLEGLRLSALVPNRRGLDRALAAGVTRIAVFAAASESFAARNLGMDVAASLRTFAEVVRAAASAGVSARGYVSTSFICPFEGEVPVEQVERVAASLLELGVDEVSLADTIGAAVPTDVSRRLERLSGTLPRERLALHFHDTAGTALANVLAGLQAGVTTFDSSAGGLGGCPFAPGAAGNLATEDLVWMAERMGIQTGIDVDQIAAASGFIEPYLGHPLPSRQLQRLRAAASRS